MPLLESFRHAQRAGSSSFRRNTTEEGPHLFILVPHNTIEEDLLPSGCWSKENRQRRHHSHHLHFSPHPSACDSGRPVQQSPQDERDPIQTCQCQCHDVINSTSSLRNVPLTGCPSANYRCRDALPYNIGQRPLGATINAIRHFFAREDTRDIGRLCGEPVGEKEQQQDRSEAEHVGIWERACRLVSRLIDGVTWPFEFPGVCWEFEPFLFLILSCLLKLP